MYKSKSILSKVNTSKYIDWNNNKKKLIGNAVHSSNIASLKENIWTLWEFDTKLAPKHPVMMS